MSKIFWTPEDIDYLKQHYPNVSSKEIALALNVTLERVYTKANALGLSKSEEFLKSTQSGRMHKGDKRIGSGTQFKKGQVPFNKGKKLVEFMPADKIEKMKNTQFKKGQTPHNSVKDWEERLLKDTNGADYIRIKVPGIPNLVFKHHYLWIQEHGEIPKDHCIVFKDKNTMNCVLENLECISRVELMERNTINRFTEELKSTIRLLAKLNKTLENEKQD